MKETIVIVIMSAFITILAIVQYDVIGRIGMLEQRVQALQELQQEKLNAFSKDVYNMTGVTELLKKQAEILQEIERRTR